MRMMHHPHKTKALAVAAEMPQDLSGISTMRLWKGERRRRSVRERGCHHTHTKQR
jgi:hypothetical protein